MGRKIRQGNDIPIAWTLKDGDGNPYIVQGKDIYLEMQVGLKKVAVADFTLQANKIIWTYYGKDQRYTGNVVLTFVENKGRPEQVTYDVDNAFELVPRSWQAVDDGEGPDEVAVEAVEITSEVVTNSIPIDDHLDAESENPVQNKVVTQALGGKYVKPSGGIPASDLAAAVQAALTGNVKYDGAQSLTDAQKQQARANIGATGPELFVFDVENATWEQLAAASEAGKTLIAFYDGRTFLEGRQTSGDIRFYSADVDNTDHPAVYVLVYDDHDFYEVFSVTIPTSLSQLNEDSTHQSVTQTEKNTWSAKYEKPTGGIPASDIASGVIPENVVKYAAQTLTDAQKAQARTNIGATAPEVFWATYGTTTAADIEAAAAAGKVVMCYKDGAPYYLSKSDSTNVYFFNLYGGIQMGRLSVNKSTNAWGGPNTIGVQGVENRVQSISGSGEETKYPSTKAVVDYVTGRGYGTYSKPANGIPATDMEQAVQTSLGKADTALQSADVVALTTAEIDTIWDTAMV